MARPVQPSTKPGGAREGRDFAFRPCAAARHLLCLGTGYLNKPISRMPLPKPATKLSSSPCREWLEAVHRRLLKTND